MFTKNERYFYERDSVREANGRNLRSVWSVNTSPGSGGGHIAAFPPRLIEPCIISSTRQDDFVLDPFFGSGTAGIVANQMGRRYAGIELNPEYVELAMRRLAGSDASVVQVAA
jgi:site-specific DNA-methyltransferase (adenine-specific)